MLRQYEAQYATGQRRFSRSPVTNPQWQKIVEERKVNPSDYRVIELWNPENRSIVNFKPSVDMRREGEYPFGTREENQEIFCLFHGFSGNNIFWDSNDPNMVR